MSASRSRRAGALVALVALVATSAAASPGTSKDDAAKATAAVEDLLRASPWYRTDLRGLVIYANGSAERTGIAARRIARFLELFDRVRGDGTFRPDRPAAIFLFERPSQWNVFETTGHIAGHTVVGQMGRYEIGMCTALGETYDTLYHELVHLGLHAAAKSALPHWYDEGLAEVLGSAVIREDVALVGGVAAFRRQTLETDGPLSLDEVLSDAGFRSSGTFDRFYADAFAFVHYASFGGKEPFGGRLPALVASLSAGQDWRAAVAEAFGEDPSAVQKDFRAYRHKLVYQPVKRLTVIRLTQPVPDLAVRPAGAPEITRALARYGEDVEIAPEVEAALWREIAGAGGETDPEVHLGLARALAHLDREQEARVELHAVPREQRTGPAYALAAAEVKMAGYRTLHEAEREDEALIALRQARPSYEDALTGWPNEVAVAVALGRTYVLDEASDPARGLEVLTHADALDPNRADLQLDLAILEVRARQYESARAHLAFVMREDISTDMAKKARALEAKIPEGRP